MKDAKSKALQLMKEEHLCVLSTLGPEGQPQSAVVGFSEDNRGRIVVGTSVKSRKYRNIKHDPRISLVIGWDKRKTIQYEGLAHEASGVERGNAQNLHISKHPENVKFKDRADETYILIEPVWVRYTDASTDTWEVEEVSLE